jgi:serine-type D-Ala-D-Ala carboxypeptidase (penicillin-binding protein 5/6)
MRRLKTIFISGVLLNLIFVSASVFAETGAVANSIDVPDQPPVISAPQPTSTPVTTPAAVSVSASAPVANSAPVSSMPVSTPTVSATTPVSVQNPSIQSNASIPAVAAPTLIPSPPEVDAKGYILIDANSGYIIAQKNADIRMPPASLTKLMTLYIVADSLRSGRIHLEDNVHVSEKAWRTGGSRMFIKVGTDVPVDLLIQGIAIASGNDATIAMAEFIAGSDDSFAGLMNQTAAKLGMNNTHYTDSNGLPSPDHYSTPSDMARLARAWIQHFPEYYPWFSQKWFVYNNIKQPNRNRLLWQDSSVDGLKTGHTDEAGYCLVVSAKRNGDMRLISVVMGSESDKGRTNASQALVNYGFRFFETHKIYSANTMLTKPRTWYGKENTTDLGIARDLYVTVPYGQYKNIKVTLTPDDSLHAPILKGKSYGKVMVTLNDKVVAEEPLAALQDNPECGFFSRMMERIKMWFHKK